MKTIRKHQKKALDYALQRKRIALFMEMRLGKTLVAIRWARPHCLVVCPASVIPVWERELWEEDQEYEIIGSGWNPPEPALWCLCSYKRVSMNPEIVDAPWSTVILDESTNIKNPKAETSKAMMRVKAPYRALLTGLPNPEGEEDYFMQMRFLYGRFMRCSNYWQWRQTFMEPGRFEWHLPPENEKLVKDAVHDTAFFMSRTQAGLKVPEVHEARYCELPDNVMREYRKVRDKWELLGEETDNALVAGQWMAQLTGGCRVEGLRHNAKLKLLKQLLMGELRRESVVVWFRYNAEVYQCRKLMKDLGIRHYVVTGKTKSSERSETINRFQRDRGRSVLLAQAKCARYGLDCSRAGAAIYYSRHYDTEINAQTKDRIVDVSQNGPKLIVDLIARGTIDEKVVELVEEKRAKAKVFNKRLREFIEGAEDRHD